MPNESDIDHKKDGTRVDLGEDLLQKESTQEGPAQSNLQEVFDLFQNAVILKSEGWIEDSKKTLHKILIMDPHHASARLLLSEIHELELKQIFGVEEPQQQRRGHSSLNSESSESSENFGSLKAESDPDILMRNLDRDLQLGLFSSEAPGVSLNQLSLFSDSQLLDQFGNQLEKDLETTSAQDWIDLGIAFLEMEIYPIAVRLFAGASHRVIWEGTGENQESSQMNVSAVSLLAYALILSDRPLDAVPKIEHLLRDIEIQHKNKVDLFYLMGRTYEAMNQSEIAFHYFRQVNEIEPNYRDVDYRMSQLTSGKR